MDQVNFVFLALSLYLMTTVNGYPSGPPVEKTNLCRDMDPTGHGTSAQGSASSYAVTVSQTCYKTGDKVKVEVKGDTFKGYFVQARNGNANSASYGKFRAYDNNGQKSLSCFTGQSDNAIGHTNGNDKSSTYFYWEALASDNVDVTFTATIVKMKTVYWRNVKPASAMRFDPNCTETTVQPSGTPNPNSGDILLCNSVLMILAGAITAIMF